MPDPTPTPLAERLCEALAEEYAEHELLDDRATAKMIGRAEAGAILPLLIRAFDRAGLVLAERPDCALAIAEELPNELQRTVGEQWLRQFGGFVGTDPAFVAAAVYRMMRLARANPDAIELQEFIP